MAILHVRTFARYAELLGDPITLDVALPLSVRDVTKALRAGPNGHLLPAHLLVAIDQRAASLGDTIHGFEEIALLPPFAGG